MPTADLVLPAIGPGDALTTRGLSTARTADATGPRPAGVRTQTNESSTRPGPGLLAMPQLVSTQAPALRLPNPTRFPLLQQTSQDGSDPLRARSPERTGKGPTATSAAVRYTWDTEVERMLRSRLHDQPGPPALIGMLSSAPTSPDPAAEPDSAALAWFRGNYSEPPATHRREAVSVQLWIEECMAALQRSLEQQQVLKHPGNANGAPAGQQQPGQQQLQGAGVSLSGGVQGPGQVVTHAHVTQVGQARRSPSPRPGQLMAAIKGDKSGTVGTTVLPGGVVSTAGQAVPGHPPPGRSWSGSVGQVQGGGGGAADVAAGRSGVNSPARPSYRLTDDGRESVVVVRDGDGFISTPVLYHQEQVLTKAIEELCGQVGALCVERGHIMWQLWAALRHMLRLMVQDRELARQAAQEARKREAEASEAAAAKAKALSEDMDELRQMNEVLNRRLLTSKAELESARTKIGELEVQVAELSDFNPAVLQQQISDLQSQVQMLEKGNTALNIKLEASQRESDQSTKEANFLSVKLNEARNEVANLASEVAVRTPRPSQPRVPPWELITEEEGDAVQLALREGCSAVDMHRLLLGVSISNLNVLPWIPDFMGICRHWNPAAAKQATDAAAAAGADGGQESQGAGEGGGGEGSEDLGSPSGRNNNMKRVQSAAHLQRAASLAPGQNLAGPAPPTRGGTTGGGARTGGAGCAPGTGGTGGGGRRGRAASLVASTTPIKDLHPHLSRLIASCNVSFLSKALPPEVVQAVAQMVNHGIDADSIACLLLGSMSPEGIELTSYKHLAGIFATRFNATAEEIGGPITEALQMAAAPTRERVTLLEAAVLREHRTAVKLRRAVIEQRRQADDNREREARQQARKLARKPHPLRALLDQKRPESFMGLGAGDPLVPMVLQAEGRIYRRTLEKADAERMVHAVWRSKRDFETSNEVAINLADFLLVYLQRKHGNPKQVFESAYNLLHTLNQHSYDPDCNLFLKVFMGEVDERVKSEQDTLKNVMLGLFREVDTKANTKMTGWVLKSDMQHALKEHFVKKSDAQLEELYDALDSDEPRELVNYNRLFDDDTDLNQGVFAETLRQQHLNELLDFFGAVEEIVLDQCEKNGTESVSPAGVAYALRKAHPNLDPAQIEEMQARVFGQGWQTAKKGSVNLHFDEALRLLRVQRPPNMVSAQQALDMLAKAGAKGAKGAAGRQAGKGMTWGENEEQTL